MLLRVLKELLKQTIASPGKPREAGAAQPKGSGSSMSEEEAECRRTLERMPNFAEAHNRLGVVLKAGGHLAEAEAAFRHAIRLERNNVVAHYNLAIVLAESGHPLEAEAAYRTAIRLQPNFADAYNNLGVLLMQAKRWAESEASFRRALELKPDFTDAEKNLALVIGKCAQLGAPNSERQQTAQAQHVAGADAGGSRDAELAYREALNRKPDSAETHNTLGVLLAKEGRLVEAEAAFRRAIELLPAFADAHNNLGGVLKDTERPVEAEACFRQAIILDAHHEAAHMNRRFVVKEIKRLTDAEAARRRAVETHSDSAISRYKLGLAQMALEKVDEAVVSFKQALAIDPARAEIHDSLGSAFARKGDLDSAIACYRHALAEKSDFANAMANLGAAHHRRNELQEAQRWNRAALAVDPYHVNANRNMARILHETGENAEAKRHLDQARSGQSLVFEYAAEPKRTVLVLWTKRKGNVPTVEFLFPTTDNTRVNWQIESERDDQTDKLPDYDLVFNAMGDPDQIGDALGPQRRFAEICTKPLLNHPAKVARTARDRLPALLEGIANTVVPRVWRFADRTDWHDALVDQLPLLVRPVDSHGGTGLELARTAAELERCRSMQAGPVYVSRFVDFRAGDSWYRKYRIIFVDREPCPYHLGISQNWMVHYFTADMEAHPWKLEEEKAFLRDPVAALGAVNMEAIRAIGARLDLEYAGIDFSILPDNRLLVFEANPLMLVHPEAIGGPTEYKNEYVFRIQRRFDEMLNRFTA